MPYKCNQSVSPYHSSKLSTSSNSIRFSSGNSIRKTNASSPPVQHHQEQNVKLMPKLFSLSQSSSTSLPLYSSTVASSTSLPLYSSTVAPSTSLPLYSGTVAPSTSLPLFSTMASSNNGKARLSETFFAQNDNDDMQPLDLSMHPMRDEQTVKQPMTDQHKPVCLVKSCACSTQPGHLSPHHITEQDLTQSPLPGMTLSSCSHENSPLYTQHQISTYHTNSNKTTSSPSAVPKISSWTTTEASPFQLLITSDKVLNGAHNSSGLYRPYDNHIMHQDLNVSMDEEAERESLATLSKHDSYNEENDEPTYMDLDSTTTVPQSAKPISYTGNSSFSYNNLHSSQLSFKYSRNNVGNAEAVFSPYQSPLLQALNSKKNNDFSGQRSSPYFAGSVISHTSFEKNHKKIIGKTSIVQNSEKAAHPQEQLPLPDSSTSPAIATVSTGYVNVYRLHTDTHPTTTVQHQDTNTHTATLHNDYPSYFKTSMSSQHLPSSTNQMHLMQSSSKSPTDQESNAVSEAEIHTSNKMPSNVQLPVSTNTLLDGVSENKHKRTGGCLDDSPQVTSDQEGNNSTKISLLDFWISKILMERSMETSQQQKKPCNVDYICTANGEKRIRLRLVDLMEMQVEQSMKA